jgi:hypothetical protein
MDKLPDELGELEALRSLNLDQCSQLTALPESFGQLWKLQCLNCRGCSQLATLPGSLGNLTALQQLNLSSCKQLTALPMSSSRLAELQLLDLGYCDKLAALPQSIGQLAKLRELHLDSCESLEALPESIGELAALTQLVLCRCYRLSVLPVSVGGLRALKELKLQHCSTLEELPDSCAQLKALTWLNLVGCSSLVQPLPDAKWSPQQKIAHVLTLQRRRPAILKLATQQETMLATLERMSWLAVLLATATFIAFMQPPGGLRDEQVLVTDRAACTWQPVPGDAAAPNRSCALLAFFILEGLSFGFSMGCIMMIIVLSMPRLQHDNIDLEAGRFWLLLLVTWVLLYCAVVTGFGAFIASGLAVYNRWGVVFLPVVPGMLLLVVGFAAIVTRFHSLHPGASAVWAALLAMMKPCGSCVYAKVEDSDPDVDMGQSLFWKHCKRVLGKPPLPQQQQPQQQHTTGAAAGQSSGADETARLLDPLDPGASSSSCTA